jgi:hypothetical protein
MKKAKALRGPKEVYIEAEKARKANNQGQWIRGRWERKEDGTLKWIIPKFIPGPAA